MEKWRGVEVEKLRSGEVARYRTRTPLSTYFLHLFSILAFALASLSASAGTLYVSTTGSDETGDGSAFAPYATVQKAVTNSANFGEIRVQGGLYVGNISIGNANAASNLTFTGCWDENWENQDYRNSRTILKSKSTSQTVIFMENVQTNSFDGFDITGGYYGVNGRGQCIHKTSLKSFAPYTHFIFTRCAITNNSSCGFYHNVNESGDGDYGYACASCLIAFNGSNGLWVKNDQSGTYPHCYLYNCTIVSNKSSGVYGDGNFNFNMLNSIVAFNGTSSGYDLNAGSQYAKMYLKDLCAYGGKSGVQGGNASAYVAGSDYLQIDPKFTGLFQLSAASYCNKSGTDLSSNAILPVVTDFYGTPWNGQYDRGCFKSEHARTLEKFNAIYVAKDGNDDNKGDAPERAVATISIGQIKLESSGTLHIGEGTFGESVTLLGAGASVVGAGRNKTILKSSGGVGVSVCDHYQTISDLTIDGFGNGVQLNAVGGQNPTHVSVTNCEIRNCSSCGLYMSQDNVNNVPYTNLLSHCVVSNCSSYGIRCAGMHSGSSRRGNFICDNTLLAFCNPGFYSDFQYPGSGANLVHFVNCTVVSNKSSGVTTAAGLPTKFTNCILFDNGSKNAGTSGGTLTLEYSLCNGMLSPGGSLVSTESYTAHDPLFGPRFTLTEKSLANKTGKDVSGGLPSYATDLADASWNGAYDMGCFKSPYEKYVVKTFDEIWVAADGNDDNTGADASHPVATLSAAALKLNAGGTLHVGEGTYAGCFSLYGDGAKILGAGRNRTILKNTDACGVGVYAHSQVIQGLTLDGFGTGVIFNKTGGLNPTNVVIRDCEIRNCTSKGVYMAQDNANNTPYTNFFSHCVISNCSSYGIHAGGMHSGSYRRGRFLIDNSLFAYNGNAFYSDFQPPSSGANLVHFVNCTVVSNKSSGVATSTNLPLTFTNCILFDNGTKNAGTGGGSTLTLVHSLCNALLSPGSTQVLDESYVSHDPKFGPGFTLTEKSLANKSGADVSAGHSHYATDLAGASWNGAYDMGCFKSPYEKYVVVTYDEVWVAKDGSNDNEGNTPDAPLATLPGAQVKLKAGGTVHLGPGTFTENNFTLYGAGAKLLGAGQDKTVVKITTGCGTIVADHGALVEGIAFEGATGVRMGEANKTVATNVTVRNCTFRKCATGWYAQQDNAITAQFTNYLSHCTFSNCTSYAVRWQGIHGGSPRYGRLLATTCLFTGNANVCTTDLQPPGGTYKGANQLMFVNCTAVNNTAGFASQDNVGYVFDNCILVDDGATLVSMSSGTWLTVRRCLLNGTCTVGTKTFDTHSDTNVANVAALKFDGRPGREYWLTHRSPARRMGSRALAKGSAELDLVGRPARGNNCDVGCYYADFIDGLMILVR